MVVVVVAPAVLVVVVVVLILFCNMVHCYLVLCLDICCLLLRTARGTETGSSLSFVCDSEVTQLKEVEAKLTGGAGGLDQVNIVGSYPLSNPLCVYSSVNETPIAVKPYKFKMSEIDGFRYRVKVSTLSVLSFSKVHGIYTISIMYGIYTISIMYSIYTINIMYNIYIPVCTVLFYLLCAYFSFQI